jgi:hypothetical protein
VKTRGKVLKPGSLLAKSFECNEKARRNGGLFCLLLFYRNEGSQPAHFRQFLRFGMNKLEDYFHLGA